MYELEPKLPEHVAIIMDGNRRWARARSLPVIEGHRAGFEAMKTIIRYGFKKGVKELSFYAFSTENWHRPEIEVSAMMRLGKTMAKKELAELNRENVKVRVPQIPGLAPADVQKVIDDAVTATKNNTGGTVNLCFSYGGRADIVNAAKELISSGISPDKVDEKVFSAALSTIGMRDVDLLIRTSEYRLSNFLPWESIYAELFILADKLWPDFTTKDFDKALDFFAARNRTFGK